MTYGLTELYDKTSPRADESGFGFELTLRLTREQGEMDPPAFALNFLQNLARHVFGSGHVFSHGHTMDLNGPIALGRTTRIAAVCERSQTKSGKGGLLYRRHICSTDGSEPFRRHSAQVSLDDWRT